MPFLSVPFTNNHQEKTFWCWAAVAANVYNSMRPSTVPSKSQCDVVTMVEGCCQGNQPDALSSALSTLGINDRLATRPRFAVIENEFSGIGEPPDSVSENGIAEPVCAEILFPGNAVHYVAISAVDTDTQHVWIADPYVGGPSVEFSYIDFTTNYHYAEPPARSPGVVQDLQRVVNKWQVKAGGPGAFATSMPPLPPDIRAILAHGLPRFRSFNTADSFMKQMLIDDPQALQVFTMGVPDVLPGGAGLRGAKASGWRVAVTNNDTAIAADIYTVGQGGLDPRPEAPPRLACVRQGPEIQIMLRAIKALSTPPLTDQLPAAPFNVRLLIMPGLFTDALWLQPQDPGSAAPFIIPFRTSVEGINLRHPYTEQELITKLRPIAETWTTDQQKLASDEGLER